MTFFIWDIIKPAIEIIVLWFVFYRILVFFEGTRAFQVLRGIMILLIFFIACQIFGLDIISWLLTKFFALSIIAFMIIFQQELRQGLARLGQQNLFHVGLVESEVVAVIDEISVSVFKLARQKIGALIALEKETKLTPYVESGIQVDAKVTSELIQSIFNPQAPTHDGGVIIRGDRIVASSCLFPLSDNPNFSKIIGTRHRAALGITEQTDTIAVVVSEETGDVSVAAEGKLIPAPNKERLFNIIKTILIPETTKQKNKSNEQTENHPQLGA